MPQELLAIIGSRKPGDTPLFLWPASLVSAPFTCPVHSSRNNKTSEKQIAMIAQKMVDANHA